jgi:uncharacterized DUF497 family protein
MSAIFGGTFIAVEIAFDPIKSAKNAEERGLPFDRAAEFDFTTAIVRQDTRHDYPEPRYQALGAIGEQICLLVFTPIPGTDPGDIRVISLRSASRKERRAWLASQNQD